MSPSECRQATHAAHKKRFGTEAPRERDRDTQHCGVGVALCVGHAMEIKRGTSEVQGFACCSDQRSPSVLGTAAVHRGFAVVAVGRLGGRDEMEWDCPPQLNPGADAVVPQSCTATPQDKARKCEGQRAAPSQRSTAPQRLHFTKGAKDPPEAEGPRFGRDDPRVHGWACRRPRTTNVPRRGKDPSLRTAQSF